MSCACHPTVVEDGAPSPGPRALLAAVSLRQRLVAVLVALALVALAVTSAFAVGLLRRELVAKLDAQVLATAQAQIHRPGQRQSAQPAGLPTSTFGIVLYDAGFTGLLAPKVGDRTPDLTTITSAVITAHDGRVFTVSGTGDTSPWRVVAIRVTDLNRGPGTMVIGQSLADVQDTLAQMRILLAVVAITVLVAIALIGWVVVQQTLRPLREVEDVAGAIAAGDLSRRVPEPSPSTEVGRLAVSLNAMLSQIEQAFAVRAASQDRMRRFISDASHELRTPLAAVRGYAELYRQGAVRDPAALATTMRRIEDESIRMGGLVEDLLTLARMDEQRLEQREPVDLTVVAADAVQDARVLDPGRAVALVGRAGPLGPTLVLGDEPRLRQVVTNLVANALRHTPSGTQVELAVGSQDGYGVLEVRDHGPGIPAEQADRVFERFFRTDSSRQRASGGSGLGLAIVTAIVAAHGGQVGVSQTAGGGATFAVRLPALTASPSEHS